ncbi:UV-stimulated scaffold protein A-like [Polypterus senegalus]|uniref:UV-stimulated scaffold protein A-like n=1 Tax=Polypterus senegalus TaxID=55291 RepID=UPI001965FF52|nr:UV-stimulated scaffold protein A-like [Polypterus senegalus]
MDCPKVRQRLHPAESERQCLLYHPELLVKMDNQKRETLSTLVEELTTSGQPQLDSSKMKQLKQICKSSNEYIDHIYHLIMTQLNMAQFLY